MAAGLRDHYNKRETRKLCRRQADSRTTKNWPIKPAHSFCINPPSFQSHKFFFLPHGNRGGLSCVVSAKDLYQV